MDRQSDKSLQITYNEDGYISTVTDPYGGGEQLIVTNELGQRVSKTDQYNGTVI